MGKYYIRPIPITKGPRDRSMFTGLYHGQAIDSVKYIWLIEGAGQKVLVDAGQTAQGYMPREKKEERNIQSPGEGLGKLGLSPRDIDIVILTHMHYDHMALASEYTRAKFVVQKAELDFGRNPHPVRAHSYDHKLWEPLPLDVVEGDKQIIDGIRVLLTPGHTVGGQSVAVDTPRGVAIITGFCCTADCFNTPPEMKARGLQVGPLSLFTNAYQLYDSALKVKQSADIILANHDQSFIDKPRVP
ncbi:MAG: N-acyl homoserine lactonase family protein [Chloroflexi bacterium]|nr:N-acyl homoserine lactonase family protein [Chloroflexota bacterium]